MLDSALEKRSLAVKLSVKATVSLFLVVLAVALPQFAHVFGGAQAGAVYMPMYLPALLAGLILGRVWGLSVGVLSPVASWAFTTLALGSAMPAAAKLPCMMLELGIFGLVSGMFPKLIAKTPVAAFPVVLGAQAAGRVAYIVYNLIAGADFASVWSSVCTGMIGLWLQAIIAPAVAIILCKVIKNEQKTE